MKLIFIVLFLATVSGRSHAFSRRRGLHPYPKSPGRSGAGSRSSQIGWRHPPTTPRRSGIGLRVSHPDWHPGGSHPNTTTARHSGPGSRGIFYPRSTGKSGNSNSSNVYQKVIPHYERHQPHDVVKNNDSRRLKVHYHYHYSPPQQISYASTFYPVYQGQPPVYVYKYRDSGSRFNNLLTGLALYNLGRNSLSHHHGSEKKYSGTPGEVCKLGISKRTGEYEETRIDCNLMSSFIWEDTTSATRNEQHVVKNTTELKVTQTVNGSGNSSVTTVSVTSNTVEDALNVKGPSIAVTAGMTCYMIRTFRDTAALRKPVDCGLLQEYARRSLYRNAAQCLMPVKAIIFNFLLLYLVKY